MEERYQWRFGLDFDTIVDTHTPDEQPIYYAKVIGILNRYEHTIQGLREYIRKRPGCDCFGGLENVIDALLEGEKVEEQK